MKCSNCGFEINTGSKFCPKCGTPTIQNNNPDPEATVAVNNHAFRTNNAESVPSAPPVYENIPADNDLNATVAFATNEFPAVDKGSPILTAEDDPNATLAMNYGGVRNRPQPEPVTPPVYDNNIQSSNLDGTVKVNEHGDELPPPPIPPTPPKKEKKKNKTLIIILSAVGAVIVIAGILVTLMLTDVIPNIFEKSGEKTEQTDDNDEDESDDSATDTTDTTVSTDEPSDAPASDTPSSDTPVPDTPAIAPLSEAVLEGSWEGSIDIGEYFESLADGIELPELPVSGTYTFDGNGTLTRTLDTQQLTSMLSVLAESNDNTILALLAYTASAFDGDKTFSYSIQDDQVIIDNGRSVLEYTENATLTGILAGCNLELEK